MKNDLIVKHNKIIEGKYNMTTTEIKIIAKLTSLIKKDDDDFKEHTFVSKNLLNELNLGSENYTALEESINKLISRRIEIEQDNKKKKLVTTFLSSCIYDNSGDESKIILRYDPNLKPYFIQLGSHFTKYYLENVLALNSFYAIRIYELCKQYEKIKERIIQIDNLKEILEIEDKYKKYNDFKKKILDIAKREINEKTDINISFEEIKTGRKITSIKFLITKKHKEEVQEIKAIEKKSLVEEIPFYSQDLENLYLLCKIQTEEIKKLIFEKLKKINSEIIKSNILYANKNAKDNYFLYLKKAIEEDYSKQNRELEEIKKQKKLKAIQQAEEEKKRKEEKDLQEREEARKIFNSLSKEKILNIKNKFENLNSFIRKNTSFEIFAIQEIIQNIKFYKN